MAALEWAVYFYLQENTAHCRILLKKVKKGGLYMYFIDGQLYRCFSVSMAFEREVTEDEFSEIIQKVPQLITSVGIAERVTKCLKKELIICDDTNYTTVKFIMDMTNRLEHRIRRSDIENEIRKHFKGVEVHVLVD